MVKFLFFSLVCLIAIFSFNYVAFAENEFIFNKSFEEVSGNQNPIAGQDPGGIEYWWRWLEQDNERSNQYAHSGNYSFKAWGNGGIFQDFRIPIEREKSYEISCYMFTSSSDQLKGGFYGIIKLEWLDANREVLFEQTQESVRFNNTMTPDEWKLISVAGVAPATVAAGRVALEFRAEGTGGGSIFWDDVEVKIISEKQIGEEIDWIASASSVQENYAPELAIDGDLNTRWSSESSDNQWWMLDFGKPMKINKITLYWEDAYSKSYRILVSSDGTSWEQVYTTRNGRGGPEAIKINPVTVRYVKLALDERATQWGNSLWEVKFDGLEVLPEEEQTEEEPTDLGVPPEEEPTDLGVPPEEEQEEIDWEW